MSEEGNKALAEADEAIEAGAKLVSAQEARVAEMREAGLNVSKAEALLEAYRYAVRVTVQNKDALLAWFKPHRSGMRNDEGDNGGTKG
jgi:hypothetical protein